MLGRDDEYVSAPGARAPRSTWTAGDALRAARCAFWIGINLILRGEPGARDGLARPRPAAGRARGRRLRRAGAICCCRVMFEHAGGRRPSRPRSPPEPRPSRSASASATPDLFALAAQDQGILLIKRGRVAEGLRAARRGDGGGHRGRAVADRQRLRLLRRDHGLPGRLRAAPRAGVDRGADALVRAAARHGQLHRHLPRAPGRDHAAARRLARRARRRRGAPASGARWRANESAAAQAALPAGRGPSPARASSPPPRRRTGGRARGGFEPQPGLALLRLAQGNGEAAAAAIRRAAGRDHRAVGARAALLPACVEIMLAAGDPQAARSACARARGRSPRAATGGMLGAIAAHARGAVDLAEGDAARRAGRAAPRVARRGASSRRRTRRRARACWWAWPAPRSGDEDTAASELDGGPRGRSPRLGRGAGRRPRRRARPARRPATARADAARAGGAAPGRRRQEQPRDRRRARHQRAHRRPAPAEHLRQARRVVADRGERVRLRARPALMRAPWSEMTMPRRRRAIGQLRRCRGAARAP